jgi:hypothetical protein
LRPSQFWKKTLVPERSLPEKGVRIEGEKKSISGAVAARAPRRNIKEYWLTILREAQRPQIQLSEPGGQVKVGGKGNIKLQSSKSK